MLMTEEQAKQCWCPFARVESSPMYQAVKDPTTGETVVPLSNAVSVNRGGAGAFEEVCCMASRCMMWRQENAVMKHDRTRTTSGVKSQEPHGYCGLASRPESV